MEWRGGEGRGGELMGGEGRGRRDEGWKEGRRPVGVNRYRWFGVDPTIRGPYVFTDEEIGRVARADRAA